MSFFDIIGRLFGLVPDAVKAGEEIAEAVKPKPKIDPADATLFHVVTYPKFGNFNGTCTVCQRAIPPGFANELCSEAVRRRQDL